MADEKENCVRMTRAATKRKASMAAILDDERISKKRVVLGELPNLSNIKNPRKAIKQKKPVSIPTLVTVNSDIDTRSDDPQMCGSYVTSIFEYLRQLEVNKQTHL